MISETSRWLTGGLVYPQIADRLREKITSGEYPVGGALPSEAALVEEFHVARTTVRRGLAVLESEGLIVTMPGKGRVVKEERQQVGAAEYRYQVIARDLRAQIRGGVLAVGAVLPSENVLRRQYVASRNTVRHALGELEREGLIVTAHGKGRFVRPLPD
ncbi:GntR family transcriptional regulator [Streptosporangium sp. LJ11]|uniref:GntR family transcriptional regulator n=1 Tax=Streptosporangium sp. LJ11 TaxID=3436927 RepID=UPI003F79088B